MNELLCLHFLESVGEGLDCANCGIMECEYCYNCCVEFDQLDDMYYDEEDF